MYIETDWLVCYQHLSAIFLYVFILSCSAHLHTFCCLILNNFLLEYAAVVLYTSCTSQYTVSANDHKEFLA